MTARPDPIPAEPASRFDDGEGVYVYSLSGETARLFFPLDLYYPDATPVSGDAEDLSNEDLVSQAGDRAYFSHVRHLLSRLEEGLAVQAVFEGWAPDEETPIWKLEGEAAAMDEHRMATYDAEGLFRLTPAIDWVRMAIDPVFSSHVSHFDADQKKTLDAFIAKRMGRTA